MRIGRQITSYILFLAVVSSTALLAISLYQNEPAQNTAQLVLPGAQTFVESFDSTLYRDINYSSVTWDTTAGRISVPTNRTTARAVSLAIDKVSDSIQKATLAVNTPAQVGTTAYFMSNDNGLTFEPVTPGQEHIFASQGSKLKWKAELTKDANGDSPVIDEVAVVYSIETPDHLISVRSVDPVHLAIETSRQLFAEDGEADAVILGRNTDVIDTFVATPLAVQRNAPLLFTPPDHLDPDTAAEMVRVLGDRNKTVIIVGGESAIGNGVIGDLFAQGFGRVERLGGETRYETAQQIAESLISADQAAKKTIYLTEARYLADAFSASAPAGAQLDGSPNPILLTERASRSAHQATAQLIEKYRPETLIVVGGPASISDSAVSDLVGRTGVSSIQRLFGVDRFGTNSMVVQQQFLAPKAVVVVDGQPTNDSLLSSYDRLMGGLVAAFNGAPLIFAKPDALPADMVTYLYNNAAAVQQGFLIGNIEDQDLSTQLYNLISHE